MAIKKLETPSFQNVGPGQVAIIPELDLVSTYLALFIKLTGTSPDVTSHLGEIKLRMDGKEVLPIEAAHMHKINGYYNESQDVSYLMIPFADFESRTWDGLMMGAIDMTIRRRASITVEVDSSAPSDIGIDSWALVTNSKRNADGSDRGDRQLFKTFIRSDQRSDSAKVHQLHYPLGGDGTLVKAVHNFSTTIEQADVKRNGVDMLTNGDRAMMEWIQNRRTRTTQSGLFVIDFALLNNQSDTIPTLLSDGKRAPWRFDIKTSGAEDITAYTEVYTTIDRL